MKDVCPPKDDLHCSLKMLRFENEVFFLDPTQTPFLNERRHKVAEVVDHKEIKTLYMFLLLLSCSSVCMALLIKTSKKQTASK